MMEISTEKIQEYAQKYDKRFKGTDDETIEKEMKEWFERKRYLDRERFIKIGLWKSKRPAKHYENNDDLVVREVTRFSFATPSAEARIKVLSILNGVSYPPVSPVASVILHFAFPDQYPILDFRAIWSLGWPQPKKYDFVFWQKYCEKIRSISQETGERIRTVDKALWEYSKEHQPKREMAGSKVS